MGSVRKPAKPAASMPPQRRSITLAVSPVSTASTPVGSTASFLKPPATAVLLLLQTFQTHQMLPRCLSYQPPVAAGLLSAVWQRLPPGIFCRSDSSRQQLQIRFCHQAPVITKISAVAAFRVTSVSPPALHRLSGHLHPAPGCAVCSSHHWFSISACASRTVISVRRSAR